VYSRHPSFVLGFHGCDHDIAEDIFNGKTILKPSTNDYDWLGNGVYFWENNPVRALEYARHIQKNPERTTGSVKKPAVIGAIIDLGNCLNLMESESIKVVKEAHKTLSDIAKDLSIPLPINKNVEGSNDFLLRHLDCLVVEFLHTLREKDEKFQSYSSARGLFKEGSPAYTGAAFYDKTHIQICVRNPNCIKGYFRPLTKNQRFPIP